MEIYTKIPEKFIGWLPNHIGRRQSDSTTGQVERTPRVPREANKDKIDNELKKLCGDEEEGERNNPFYA